MNCTIAQATVLVAVKDLNGNIVDIDNADIRKSIDALANILYEHNIGINIGITCLPCGR